MFPGQQSSTARQVLCVFQAITPSSSRIPQHLSLLPVPAGRRSTLVRLLRLSRPGELEARQDGDWLPAPVGGEPERQDTQIWTVRTGEGGVTQRRIPSLMGGPWRAAVDLRLNPDIRQKTSSLLRRLRFFVFF